MNETYGREIGWRELLAELLKAKWLIVACAVAGMVIGVGIGMIRTKWYEAHVILSPVADGAGARSLGGLSGLVSQYSGLASLAGISLSEGGSATESIAVLQSELMTSAYIQENNLLPVLFAKGWDAAGKKWKGSSGEAPSLWAANQYFARKIRSVTQDAKTGLVTLTIRWSDSQQAALWANELVARTNDYLRSKALDESDRNVKYLSSQAEQATVLEARRAMNSLLEQEINKAMIARGRQEYALRVIDPAVPPEQPVNIGKITLGALLGVLGGIAAFFFLLVRMILRSV